MPCKEHDTSVALDPALLVLEEYRLRLEPVCEEIRRERPARPLPEAERAKVCCEHPSTLHPPPTNFTEGFTHVKDDTPSDEGGPRPVSPIYRVGAEVIFKFEGNLRARVAGYEVVDGRVRLDCRASFHFLVPLSLVVGVEPEE